MKNFLGALLPGPTPGFCLAPVGGGAVGGRGAQNTLQTSLLLQLACYACFKTILIFFWIYVLRVTFIQQNLNPPRQFFLSLFTCKKCICL